MKTALYIMVYSCLVAAIWLNLYVWNYIRTRARLCDNCDGSGIDPIEPEHGCNCCDGTGRIGIKGGRK